ncbi:MAG: [FeFe] hydrogenase H-cluster maturation GTPase HydF [Bacteroidales bacterium]|nr:[FeFe] hydrogenase H-cluster maturation GTPase HydF [Lentimicrobiaceae bacterium]MDD5694503.1 [FeFe] hydrogenase H-cluster maturation GTPase HydF [Bacteroidales bacterium]
MTRGRETKPHIGIFGRRNTGKSSFINALVNQQIAIVSDQAGTTTDPVRKSIEIFGIGPAIVIDTAGIDDVGELGSKRVSKTMEVLRTVDCAVLLIDGNRFGEEEMKLIRQFGEWEIPYLIVHNKEDKDAILPATQEQIKEQSGSGVIRFSTFHNDNLLEVIEALRAVIPDTAYQQSTLIGDMIHKNDYIVLITPIDEEAPDGRMILPQVMVIRDVLDHDAINIVLKENQVEQFFRTSGIRPALAITDSQVFSKVKDMVPETVPLTSFSILMARRKGNFTQYLKGTPYLDQLKDGDRVLILESCTHQVNCDDIGRYKLPRWIRDYTGKNIEVDVVAGLEPIQGDIRKYSLIIQCGGCMVTRKQLLNRLKPAIDAGVPVSNYGLAIAYMNGIFHRVTAPFTTHQGSNG